jgi:hypothetical protein
MVMQTKVRKVVSDSIFLLGIGCILLSSIFHLSDIFYWLTGLFSLIYFFGGWYLFKGYFPEGNSIFLFLIGYIYSGIFMGAAFASKTFLPSVEFLKASLFWSIILIATNIVAILLDREKYQKGLKYFLIQAIILLILSITQKII